MTTDAYVGALLVLITLVFVALAGAVVVAIVIWRRISALAAVVEAARTSAQSIAPLLEAANKLEPIVKKLDGRVAYVETTLAGVPEGLRARP